MVKTCEPLLSALFPALFLLLIFTQTVRGKKFFELSNHLGNVLATVSDKKEAVDTTADGNVDYYVADVVTANDYYPFGMLQPNRQYQAGNSSYRYGFNGQEKSNEIKGEGNSYTAEFWEYDPRLGRRWNIDPVVRATQSPYMCFNNNPLAFADLSGLDGVPRQHKIANGENLTIIAERYKTSVDNLLKWNPNIKEKDKIYAGDVLNVSDPSKILFLGKSGVVGRGEDSESSVGKLPPGEKQDINANIPDDLLEKLHSSVSTTATLGMREDEEWVRAEQTIYDRFYSKRGGVNTDTYGISKAMERTRAFKQLRGQIEIVFKASMTLYDGNYSKINLTGLFVTPQFGNESNALLALVGGTQQLDIYLCDIKVHGRQYTAKIQFWLWDDYGVSATDCVQPGTFGWRNITPVNDGLKAQWILQHNRGYKPLINGFKFTTIINGEF